MAGRFWWGNQNGCCFGEGPGVVSMFVFRTIKVWFRPRYAGTANRSFPSPLVVPPSHPLSWLPDRILGMQYVVPVGKRKKNKRKRKKERTLNRTNYRGSTESKKYPTSLHITCESIISELLPMFLVPLAACPIRRITRSGPAGRRLVSQAELVPPHNQLLSAIWRARAPGS